MDQIHMHYASTIHNVAFTVVLGYAELCSGTGDGSFQKKQYAELCKVECAFVLMEKHFAQLNCVMHRTHARNRV